MIVVYNNGGPYIVRPGYPFELVNSVQASNIFRKPPPCPYMLPEGSGPAKDQVAIEYVA